MHAVSLLASEQVEQPIPQFSHVLLIELEIVP